MIVKDSTILALQFVAAIFMATDYFFDEKQRNFINNAIQGAVRPVQNNVDSHIREKISNIVKQWAIIFVAIIFMSTAVIVVKLLPYTAHIFAPWATIILCLTLMFLLAGAVPRLTDAFVNFAVPLAFSFSMRLITSFLLHCPKGTVFGIGFLFLLASFACRYANLS